jgi:tetratricopeptide (TPR) repeat protein
VPLLVLGGLELALRLAGYGYPTSFFQKARIGGRDVVVENSRFAYRFFPPGIARSPTPIVFPARKATNTVRIFVLGESAALGDPRPAYGFGRYLRVLLGERFPGTDFEVICAATTAINSHALVPIARECARYDGDLWVVYMGNNELEGPFGAGGAFGPRAPALALVRTGLALKATRLGQLLDALSRWTRGPDTNVWSGLKHFVEHLVPPDDPARRRVEAHFRRNLADLLDAAERAGVPVLLCTVATNLRDCAPFASLHATGLPEARKAEWQHAYQAGLQAQSASRWEDALRAYRQAAEIDGLYAELQFRLAQCYEALGNVTEARAAYALARDYDALPVRATSALNQVVRQAAAARAGRGVRLVDAETALAADSPAGLAGDDLFLDHVHLDFDANYRLARVVAEEVAPRLPPRVRGEPGDSSAEREVGSRLAPTPSAGADGVRPPPAGEWLTAVQCELRLALTGWNRLIGYEQMLGRLADAPYTNRFNNAESLARLRQRQDDVRLLIQEADRKLVRGVYERALAKTPEDFYLHQNFAEFLETIGDLSGAAAEWTRVQALLPHHPIAFFQAGRVQFRAGQFAEAEHHLAKAVALRPDFIEAHLELAQALAKQGKPAEAVRHCQAALQLDPQNAVAHFRLADAVAAQGDRAAAMQHLREAVRLQPAYWEARYLLGVELALQGKLPEAHEQFAHVVRLRPDFVLGRVNLGVSLAKQGRFEDALVQFDAALRLDPTNQAAQKHIAAIQALRRRPRP